MDLSSDEEVANQEKYDIKQKKKLIIELDLEMAYLIRQINKVRSLFIQKDLERYRKYRKLNPLQAAENA